MIVLEIDLAQKAIALASGRDVLHCRRTDRSEVREAIFHERVIHPGSLKTQEGGRSFASNTIPAISVWRWISKMKNSGRVEPACFYDGLGPEVTAAERCLRADMCRSRVGPPRPRTRTRTRTRPGECFPFATRRTSRPRSTFTVAASISTHADPGRGKDNRRRGEHAQGRHGTPGSIARSIIPNGEHTEQRVTGFPSVSFGLRECFLGLLEFLLRDRCRGWSWAPPISQVSSRVNNCSVSVRYGDRLECNGRGGVLGVG